jgi:hypothetical protein
MEGSDFTYTLDFDPVRSNMLMVELVDVKRDK